MDKRKALDLINSMIKAEAGSASVDPLVALRDRITAMRDTGIHPLMKAINDATEVLKKSSGIDLDMNEKMKKAVSAPPPSASKAPALPKMNGIRPPPMPKPKAPIQAPGMQKVDPTTHLRGTLLDKNLSSGGVQNGDMGSSNQNMTPGMTKNQEKVGGAPSDAPPMMANEKHKELASKLGKCMQKSLTASEGIQPQPSAGSVRPDAGFGKVIVKNAASSTGNVPPPKSSVGRGGNVSVHMGGMGMGVGMGKHAGDSPAHQQISKILQHMKSRAPIMKSSPEQAFEGSKEASSMSIESKRAITEPADKPMKIQPQRPGQANKPVKKSEVLNKPYASDAQRHWAHTPTGEKSLGGKKAVHEWDEASKGKKLPEKVSKK
jgi:hypothetical protein